MKPFAIYIVISSIPFPLVGKQYKKYQCTMYNIVQEYLYFHGTRTQKVLSIVTVGGGISLNVKNERWYCVIVFTFEDF